MKKKQRKTGGKINVKRELPYHLMLLPGVVLVFIFSYYAMGVAFSLSFMDARAVSYTHLRKSPWF